MVLLIGFSVSLHAQQKGDNTIQVKEVSFDVACDNLLNQGFLIDKKDMDLQTVKTEFKSGSGKNKWMKFLLTVRVKDSTAIIKGEWANSLDNERSVFSIQNTNGNPKACFNEMKEFALSFGKKVYYSRQ